MRDLVEWSVFSIVNSNVVPTDSESDFSSESSDTSPTSAEKNVSVEKAELTPPETETERIELPEPDAENITVLTDKLPNKPILPWNRYDSPWEEAAGEQPTESDSEQKQENQPQTLTNEEETSERSSAIEAESDEVD